MRPQMSVQVVLRILVINVKTGRRRSWRLEHC